MQVLAVPVKSLDRAKGRLSPVLGPDERARLTVAMLEDVLDAATAQTGWEVWVLCEDQPIFEAATSRGLRAVRDTAGSLRGAVGAIERAFARDHPGSRTGESLPFAR